MEYLLFFLSEGRVQETVSPPLFDLFWLFDLWLFCPLKTENLNFSLPIILLPFPIALHQARSSQDSILSYKVRVAFILHSLPLLVADLCIALVSVPGESCLRVPGMIS